MASLKSAAGPDVDAYASMTVSAAPSSRTTTVDGKTETLLAARRMGDPHRDKGFDAPWDVHEDAAPPQGVPERDELQLVDANCRERALHELGVDHGSLLERRDDDSLGMECVRSLDRCAGGRVDHERSLRCRAIALLAHRFDDRRVDIVDRCEPFGMQRRDIGAPPVLIALRRGHRDRLVGVPGDAAARREPRRGCLSPRRRDLLPERRCGRIGQRDRHPIAPSMESASRRLSSTAYSIGSSLTKGSKNPLTIRAVASCSGMPRDVR